MTRIDALQYVTWILDDAGSARRPNEGEPIDVQARILVWQCGFEPFVVAVKSYLPNVTIDNEEAIDIATDFLLETKWFDGLNRTDPNYIL